jgi:hypothetical protein
MRHSLRHSLLLLSFGATLAGCSENRVAKLTPRCNADFATICELWNASDISSLITYINHAKFIDDPEAITARMTDLRREIGAINNLTEPMIDGQPEDPRAYAVAQLVTATERGVAKFILAYGKELTILGFHVQGSGHPSAPR